MRDFNVFIFPVFKKMDFKFLNIKFFLLGLQFTTIYFFTNMPKLHQQYVYPSAIYQRIFNYISSQAQVWNIPKFQIENCASLYPYEILEEIMLLQFLAGSKDATQNSYIYGQNGRYFQQGTFVECQTHLSKFETEVQT